MVKHRQSLGWGGRVGEATRKPAVRPSYSQDLALNNRHVQNQTGNAKARVKSRLGLLLCAGVAALSFVGYQSALNSKALLPYQAEPSYASDNQEGTVLGFAKVGETSAETSAAETLNLPVAQMPSQLNTLVDTASYKALFDYLLSGLGESDLTTVREALQQYIDTTLPPGALPTADVMRLFDQYVAYKRALADMSLPASSPSSVTEPIIAEIESVDVVPMSTEAVGVDALRQLHQQILDLQARYFTGDESEMLFADENRLRQLAIDKRQIASSAMDDEEAGDRAQVLLAGQPDYIQQAERNVSLASQLTSGQALPEQERYILRSALVGEAAAERLADLDRSRETFNDHLTAYLAKRQEMLATQGLSESDKQLQIVRLRESSFARKQWRRVQALERLHDRDSLVNSSVAP